MPRNPILDDLDKIREIDRSNMLSFCVDAAKHYDKATKLAEEFAITLPVPESIIVAGMGGSAIGGELLKDWAANTISVPIDVCRDYHLPAYANKNTLVVTTSYSGETEETLSAFLDAVKRKCIVISISSGGKLQEFSDKLCIPHLTVPKGMAPRATLPYLFMPLPAILHKIGLASRPEKDFSETVSILKQVSFENSPKRSLDSNFCKKLASEINGTIPVVYGFRFYRAVAQRIKTQINENSKNPAKWEFLPELDHNEIVGWENAREFTKYLSVIFIRDSEEAVEIRRRIEVTKEIISGQPVKLLELWSKGKSSLARMVSVICMGDFTSVYLALLRGVDPTPVKTIDLLKERLKQTGTKQKIVHKLEEIAKR